MLKVNNLVGWGGGDGPRSLLTIIQRLGLTTNLQCVVDPGVSASYSGSGQNLVDINGADDLYLGTGSGVDAADPTFTGTAGDLSDSTYFTCDSGDGFRWQSQPTWAETFHKDSAVLTLLFVVYRPSNTRFDLFGNNGGNSANIGCFTGLSSFGGEELSWFVTDVGTALNAQSTANYTTTGWRFFMISVDEAAGAGGSFFYGDGAEETFDATYATPSAANATYTTELMLSGNGASSHADGCLMGPWAAWSGTALTAANADSLLVQLKHRFTTLG